MATRKERVILDLDNKPYLAGLAGASAGTAGFIKQLDSGNDRATMLTQSLLAVGPALVPIGAAGVPALAGLTSQLGFATAATGVAVLAFQGVGDALDAVNKYQLEPTDANLKNMEIALGALGPAGREFVMFLQDLRPEMQKLQDVAQAELFPELMDGIDDLMTRAPQVQRIIGELASVSGEIAGQGAAELASKDWDEFFDFLENEARPTLLGFAHSVGNVLEGVANTWMALDPLSDDFTGGLLEFTRGFSDATENLDDNEGFQEFVDYVRENGPAAVDALGAVGGAMLSLIEAAAPVGAVTLPVIESLAHVLSAVAESPVGPVLIGAAAGMSALSRAVGLYNAANGSALLGMMTGVRKEGQTAAAGAKAAGSGLGYFNERVAKTKDAARVGGAAMGMLALSMTDVDDKAGLSNTAMLTLLGTMIAPGWGTAAGATIGFTMDLASANDDLADSYSRAQRAMEGADIGQQRDAYRSLRSELEQTAENQSNFWSMDIAPGDTLTDRLSKDMNALSGWVFGTADAKNELEMLGQQMKGTGGIAGVMAHQIGQTADQMRVAAGDAEALAGALGELTGWLDKRAAFREYGENVRTFSKALRDGFDPKNVEDLDNVAGSIAQVASMLKGDHRTDFLAGARKDLIRFAETGPKAERAVGKVIDELVKLGLIKPVKLDVDNKPANRKLDETGKKADDVGKKHPKPKVDADTRDADRNLTSTQQLMRALDGSTATPKVNVSSDAGVIAAQTEAILRNIPDEIVEIHTVRRGPGGQGAGYAGPAADGMTVPGPRFPYMDQVLVLTAPGEEIITNRNGEADQFRADRAAGRIPAYAGGGTVEPRYYGPAHGGRGEVVRIVERLPGQVVLSIPGMGRLVADVADARIRDNEKWHERRNDRD